MPNANQTPEQAAREVIDEKLSQAGWFVQDKMKIAFSASLGIAVREYQTDVGPADYILFIDFSASLGIAVREYQTDVGPADYILFIDKKPVGVVEAKPESWGDKITTVEGQSAAYAAAKLKWVNNSEPLQFVYESTGVLTRFTEGRDPKPRSREVFSFPRPETMRNWFTQPASLRSRIQELPGLSRFST